MKVLRLIIKKEAFDVMVTGEKKIEYRKPSRWIQGRLFDKDGRKRKYDVVEFRNGYKSDSPCFIAGFLGFKQCDIPHCKDYSNGLRVDVLGGDYMIFLGDVTYISNKLWKMITMKNIGKMSQMKIVLNAGDIIMILIMTIRAALNVAGMKRIKSGNRQLNLLKKITCAEMPIF